MPIALPIASTPSIATYDDLIQVIQDWLKDSTLEDQAPAFIALAEARMNRLLITTDMEYTVTSAGASSLALPPDYRGLRYIHVSTDPRKVLKFLSPDNFHAKWDADDTGEPENYTIIGGTLYIGPSSSDDVAITYTRTLAALSTDNTSNWMLEQNPDVYLAGSLMHAEIYGWNNERAVDFKGFWEEGISEINAANARKKRAETVETVPGAYY